MVQPQLIAAVLGGPKVLGRRVRSVLDLAEAVEEGLPKAALRNTAARIVPDAAGRRQLIYRIVPEATYKRRRERLTPAESERTERLARVIATAEYAWDAREDTHRFLMTPHPQLGGKAPMAAALTELGARQVEQILEKILFGLPA
jgi:putative toxin-antitoxin system antitoxin component (TIGR02293 family)